MGFGVQESDSSSSRGLNPSERNYFSGFTPEYFRRTDEATQAAARDPGGLDYLWTANQLAPMGQYGLPPSADAGVATLGRNMFNKASGSRAMRGFGSPANLEGVVGDATREASSTLLPLQTQYSMFRSGLPTQLRQLSMGYQLTPMQIISNLLSGTGESSASSYGFSMDMSDLAKLAAASDIRLKSNIVRLGTHPLGIGWYEYDIDGRHEQGVMAQEVLEVMPEAVVTMPNGYLGVVYDMIGRM